LSFSSVLHRRRARVALEDIDVNGKTGEGGGGRHLLIPAANRDHEISDPDRLDGNGSGSPRRIRFGIHPMLGPGARARRVAHRLGSRSTGWPNLRLESHSKATLPHACVHGVHELPLAGETNESKSCVLQSIDDVDCRRGNAVSQVAPRMRPGQTDGIVSSDENPAPGIEASARARRARRPSSYHVHGRIIVGVGRESVAEFI